MLDNAVDVFPADRRRFIGGSDARIIMGNDEAALLRLWREKRGEVEPEDLSDNLIVQLGVVTEALNRRWYEANTGHLITDVQTQVRHPTASDGCAPPSMAGSRQSGRFSRPNSCCPGHSRRKPPPRSIWHSCSITCRWWVRGRRCCRWSLVGENGSRSPPMPIRSISTSSSQPSGSSGAASRVGNPLAYSGSSRQNPAWRLFALST